MNIEKITLCNLASIEGEYVIDFTVEPLRSAGIFAITGDTGAGKSTLLDAVCLALYNEAPRFAEAESLSRETLDNLSRERREEPDATPLLAARDVRGIMRRGCRKAECSVTFSLPTGERYEAGWSVRMKRTGNYDRIQRALRQITPRRVEIPEREIPERLPQIIGLDYQQFTRTVMLAQNSFANFLKARRDEKSALLEKLTGTEIYGRISTAIYSHTHHAEEEVKAMESYVRGVLKQSLSEEETNRLKEEEEKLSAQLLTAENRRKRIEACAEWMKRNERLSEEVRESEEELVKAHKDYVAMRADELKLERYDAVVDIQPLYQEISLLRRQLEEGKRNEHEVTETMERGRMEIERTGTLLEGARRHVDEAEEKLARRRPAISRGHVLAGEIGEVEAGLKGADEEAKAAEKVAEACDKRRAEVNGRIDETQRLIEQELLHQQALAAHRTMFEKFDLVKDKLIALEGETTRNEEARKKCAELRKRGEELSETAEKYEQQRHDNEARLSTLRGELAIHQLQNRGHDSAALGHRYAEYRGRLVVLERAQSLWARISAGYEEIDDKRAELMRLEGDRRQTAKDIERLAAEVGALDEAFRRLNVTITLSRSENIRQLRRQLKEGSACPVCGATHHPYHTETERELGELLSGMEREFEEASQVLTARQGDLAALRERMAALSARIEAQQKALAEREERQLADVEEWGTCKHLDPSFEDCSAAVARDARRLMIGLLVDNNTRAAEEAKKELDEFNYHQEHINRLNEEIARLDDRMTHEGAYVENVRMQLQVAAASREETERLLRQSDRAVNQFYTDLDSMVTVSGWFADWKRNSENFRRRLSELLEDWMRTCERLDVLQRKLVVLQEEFRSMEKASEEAHRRATAEAAAAAALRDALGTKREELRRLLGNNSPEVEEEILRKLILDARNEENAARTAHEEACSTLNRLLGTQKSLQESRAAKGKEFAERMSQMDLWMLRFNGDHSPICFEELTAIFTDRTDRTALRLRLEALRKACTLAAARRDTSRAALLQLQADETRPKTEEPDTPEKAERRLADMADDIAKLNERRGSVREMLGSHERSLRDAAAYADRMNAAKADLEEWRKLCAVLGQANGMKFRHLAQGLTFGYLVEQANAQLRRLSPRYELRRLPGTLTLEVVDRDMFDRRRYVNSLSGGETFVVSLSLALALASLSSRNPAIGSLFIDEGFGNLDRASLDLVMNALANLENAQGRKVGIISHTEQIRTQISPQIRLVKLPGGGRSKIEIG